MKRGIFVLFLSVFLSFLLTGCENEGSAEKAGKEIDKASQKVEKKAEEMIDKVKEKVEEVKE